MENFNYDLLEQQNNTMKKIFDSVGGYIKGEDLASLRLQVIKICMEHKLFLRDIITGLVKSSLSESPDKPIDLDTAKNLFTVFFSDKLKLISKKSTDGRNWETKVSPVSQQMVGMLWEQVFVNCTYSSRKEYFDNIPVWDGQERIKTFMKEYFRCNSNPNFFLLLLTSIIGKIDDPEKNYCPFFFDFVSPSKGCLTGDTKINVYTKNGTGYSLKKVRIARLFDLAKNESDRVIVRSLNEHTKEMVYSEAEVVYTGQKQCYLLTTEDGLSIECSGNHRFYTDEGWVNILKLKEGDEIYANAKGATNRRDKNYRSPSADGKEFYVKYHPVVAYDRRKKCHRVREYKLIWEAHANNMSFQEYVDLLNNYDGRALTVVPKGYDIHHINGDHHDNRIENLEVLSKAEHGRIHGVYVKPKQYLARKVKIKSVVPTQIKKTYDLACVEGWHNYVANEFITHNTGKTSFFQHLLGKHAINQAMKARRDDFYVDIYNANAFVVNDDECTWPGEGFDKISHDELKTIVTQHTDTFSRKYRQPETHARAFVIVRTSNEINQVFSTNERRQIIFEIGLEEKECLHWNCDDYFMQQLLAEAKDYYLKNGVYRMTDADWSDIDQQNKDNFETDGVSFRKFKQYIEFVRSHPNDETISTPATAIFKTHLPEDWRDYIWVTWSNYADWAELNNLKEILKPRVFWRQAEAGRNFFNWMYFKKGVKHTLKSTLRTQLIGIKRPSAKDEKKETEPEKVVDLF